MDKREGFNNHTVKQQQVEHRRSNRAEPHYVRKEASGKKASHPIASYNFFVIFFLLL